MDDQGITFDPIFDGAQDASGIASDPGATSTPGSASEPPTVVIEEGKDTTMTQDHSMAEPPTSSLVGSLSHFTLADVLRLLATTGQTGELHVVGQPVDGRLWLVDGELANGEVDGATTIGQAVFDLACATDGEFSFVAGVTSSSIQPPVSVDAVLDEVGPQVDEWREIRRVVPFDALVALAPVPPDQDVQIRSDQWQVLTIVGRTGHTIGSVLGEIGGDQMVGLRTLRDLAASGLITVGDPGAQPVGGDAVLAFADRSDPPAGITVLPLAPEEGAVGATVHEGLVSVLTPPSADSAIGLDDDSSQSLAAVAIMPPPIAGDPWTPVPEPTVSSDNGVA